METQILKNYSQILINLPRIVKIFAAIFLDIILCIVATWLALCLRFWELITPNLNDVKTAIISFSLAIPIFYFCGIYKVILRYIKVGTLEAYTKAFISYTLIYSFILIFISLEGVPRSVGLMQPIILFFFVGISRLLVIFLLNLFILEKIIYKDKSKVVIYGTGRAGRQLASALSYSDEFEFLYFIDDNKNIWGGTIDKHLVKSPKILTSNIVKKPNELWLAKPNISFAEKRILINNLKNVGVHIRTLPNFNELSKRNIKLSDIRDLDINELIGRKPIEPDFKLLKKSIFKKTIVVTGAGGSIGSEICRQIIFNKPKCLILIDNSELALYNINLELKSKIEDSDDELTKKILLVPLLVNILDNKQLENIFKIWKPFIIYHAAAYKHVPLVEQNIISGITNNVFGTIKCAKIALKYNVKYFVLISTDKAVRPTNIMGASKRLAEMGLQAISHSSENKKTIFCIVRFGNVLGSSGSVVPLFRKQIAARGPLTVTHKEVTRYFMSITEASQLVIQAGSMSKGGEVFLLDMGKPVRILDIAHRMIETAGLKIKNEKMPWGDIEIKFTGLRPGEKLYEELLIGNNPQSTPHPYILKARENFIYKKQYNLLLKELEGYLKTYNTLEITNLLKENVCGYTQGKEVDWIAISRN